MINKDFTEYCIEVNSGTKPKWKWIASFDTVNDRDDCFDLLSKKYSDCKFRKTEIK